MSNSEIDEILRMTNESPQELDAGTVTVEVEPGDTLWRIAKEVGGNKVDTRKVVDDIMRLNGIDDAGKIHPKDIIVIPEQYADSN